VYTSSSGRPGYAVRLFWRRWRLQSGQIPVGLLQGNHWPQTRQTPSAGFWRDRSAIRRPDRISSHAAAISSGDGTQMPAASVAS